MNPFDQFDEPARSGGANPFDQFDAPAVPQPPASVPQNPAKSRNSGVMQSLDDVVRLFANGATGGLADKFAAYMSGVSADEERAKSAAAADRVGLAGDVAGIAGMMVPASKFAKGYQAIKALPQAPAAVSAATGAASGALDAIGHDRNLAEGAAFGAGAGLLGQGAATVASKAAKVAAGAFNKAPKAPSADDLKSSAQSAYKAAEDAGVIFNKNGANRLASEIETEMANFGYDPALFPRASGVVNSINRLAGDNVTLKGIDTLRRVTNNLRTSQDRAERKLGSLIIGKIDDFIENPRPGEVMMGDAQQAGGLLANARQIYQRNAKEMDLRTALEKASNRAGSTGSGGNIENATRQELRKIMEKGKGWTPDEKAALRTEVLGSPARNALRAVGRASPDTGAIPLMASLGAISVNPAMAGLSAAAFGARHGSEAIQRRAIEQLSELIRAGGAKKALTPAPNAAQLLADRTRDPLARALMTLQLQGLNAN